MNYRIALFLVVGMVWIGGCVPEQTNRPVGVDKYVAGLQAYNAGNKKEAIDSLMAAIEQNPRLITPRIVLGDWYRGDSIYEKALEQYVVVVRLDPYESSNHYKLGLTYQFMEKLNEAANSYKRTLQLNPKDAPAMMNLGLIALTQGRADEAQELCERAAQIDPKSASVQANLGLVLAAQGYFPEAEAAYRRSLDLNPNQPGTMLNLGSNLIRQGKAEAAIAIMEELVKKTDTPLSRKRYGDALALGKKYDEAMAQYELAIKANPRYYQAMNELAGTKIEKYKDGLELDETQRAAAVAMWKQSLAINATQPKVQEMLETWEGKGKK